MPDEQIRPVQQEKPGPGGMGVLHITRTRTSTEQWTCEQIEAVIGALLRGHPPVPDDLRLDATAIGDALREMRWARAELEGGLRKAERDFLSKDEALREVRRRADDLHVRAHRVRWAHVEATGDECTDECCGDEIAYDHVHEKLGHCEVCGQNYPCWTRRTLDGETGDDEPEQLWKQRPAPGTAPPHPAWAKLAGALAALAAAGEIGVDRC